MPGDLVIPMGRGSTSRNFPGLFWLQLLLIMTFQEHIGFNTIRALAVLRRKRPTTSPFFFLPMCNHTPLAIRQKPDRPTDRQTDRVRQTDRGRHEPSIVPVKIGPTEVDRSIDRHLKIVNRQSFDRTPSPTEPESPTAGAGAQPETGRGQACTGHGNSLLANRSGIHRCGLNDP